VLDLIKYTYDRSPKNLLSFIRYVPNQVLFGKKFGRCFRGVSTKSAVVVDHLFETLNYARDNTAFWGELVPQKLSRTDVLKVFNDLPYISSDDIMGGVDRFVSRRFNKLNSYSTTTGGTGRNPTTILLANESYTSEWAHMFHIWGTIGYHRPRDIKLTFRGKTLKGDKLFEYNPVYNEIVVDTFKLNSTNFKSFFSSIHKSPISYIHGYPSLLREFRDYLELYSFDFPVKGIMLASEGVELDEKRNIGAFFRCPVISWYGQSEKVILAADLACENKFKVFTSYGYPSLYEEDHGVGEIAGTTFVNKALPLIKYRTGDYGCIEESNGEMIISELVGRWGKDFVFVNKDKKIPTTSINIHGPLQKEILFYQIHQSKYGELLINILPKQISRFSDDTIIDMFKRAMKDKLKDFIVDYRIAKNEREILKSARGKAILLVQDLGRDSSG
jgi:phenylacetate-CoA ligase